MSWWKAAVVYQVYPRSFQDSNGDGIGDIAGLISKLDYLEWLGVDAVWLSPIFESPQADFGYDISDYCAIDQTFGTMTDVERLITELHQRGMKLIMDGVFNHTSKKHRWFIESEQQNGKNDWYIWTQKPNNWTSAFGGSAWTYSPIRDAYYLHTFASSQPDLNWSKTEVVEAILAVQKFWYEKGVDGFRLDVFNAYCKDETLQDNPRRKDVVGLIGGLFYGYIGQEHRYDRDRPEIFGVLKTFRELADQYDAVLIGETLDEKFEYRLAKNYVGPDTLHLAFDFSPLHSSWKNLPQAIQRLSGTVDHPAWVWSNHDFPRQSKRWGKHPNRAKLMLAIQILLKGTPVLYYGEEIDQPHVNLSKKDIVDPPGQRFYPFYKGRDGARTPMNWGDDSWKGTKPWLPLVGNQTVEESLQRDDSTLQLCRELIEIRRSHAVFTEGTVRWDAYGFWRFMDSGQKWYVVLNWTYRPMIAPQTVNLEDCRIGLLNEAKTHVQPYGFAIIDCSSNKINE